MKQQSHWLRGNMLYVGILLFFIAFPHLVGIVTGDGPYGIQAGRRVLVAGQSVTWQFRFIEVFILAILAMSYNLMFGFIGVISFGHALFFGIGGYVLGVALEFTGLDVEAGLIVGILVAIVISAIISLIIGLVSLRLRGVYFAIFTLAVAESFFIYFGRFSPLGAEDGFAIDLLPDWLNPTRNPLTYYYITFVLCALTFFFIRRLIHSPTGTIFLAIRENEQRARAIGYNTLTYKLLAITVAGVLAAIAGMLFVILNKRVGPELLGVGNTLNPLLMTIIGGIGTFSGPVIGATGLHLTETLLRNAQLTLGETVIDIGGSWTLILGIAFTIVVMIFPQGVVGTWQRWRYSAQQKRLPKVEPAEIADI